MAPRSSEIIMKLYTKLILAVVAGLVIGFSGFLMDKKEAPEVTKANGEAFLLENAKKPNIKTTASGLQYEILQEGEGKHPTARSKVTVHYRGTLIDGEEFDSSYSREKPIGFTLDQVIAGWTEGIQLMNKGAKFKFYIPSELAYGEAGQGKILPHSALIFEVELIRFR